VVDVTKVQINGTSQCFAVSNSNLTFTFSYLLHTIELIMANQLPETMRALVVRSTDQPPTVEQIPIPQPFHGSAVVQVLTAGVISYIRDIYNGKRKYPFPTPLVAGTSAIGRVVAVGPDAVKLKPGDLVFVDCTIRARDSDDIFLAAISQGFGEGSAKLMRDVWREWGEFRTFLMALSFK
jgi:hypothetical protein